MKSQKKVLVFGVFDKFHDGHRFFLSQAKKLGDILIVVVAKDSMVLALKNKKPTHSLVERIQNITKEGITNEIVSSDAEPNQWIIVEKIKPDIIALGYDQADLENAIKGNKSNFSFDFEIVKIGGHKSHIYHTSLLK